MSTNVSDHSFFVTCQFPQHPNVTAKGIKSMSLASINIVRGWALCTYSIWRCGEIPNSLHVDLCSKCDKFIDL